MEMEIVRVRTEGPAFDDYGAPNTDVTEQVIDGAFIAPAGSDEALARGRDGAAIDLTLFLPYDFDLRADDHIRIDGELFRVVGQPARWKNPWTQWEAGQSVGLARGQG